MNHNGRQHGLRNALHPRQQLPHQQRHHGAGDQARRLAFGTRHFIGRTGRKACPHRQALKQGRHNIGPAQRQQVAVGVDGIAMAQGQRANGAIRFSVQNQGQRYRQLPHAQPVCPDQIRQGQVRATQLQGTYWRNAPGFAKTQCIQRNARSNNQQGTGNRLPAAQQLERQQGQHQHGQPQPVPARQQRQQIPAEMQKITVTGVHTHRQRQLLDHNGQRQTNGKTAQHRFGNELRDRAQLEQPCQHKHHARHQHHAKAHERTVIGRHMHHRTGCRQQHRR